MKQARQALIDNNGQRIVGELTSVDNRIDPRTASGCCAPNSPIHAISAARRQCECVSATRQQTARADSCQPPRSSRTATGSLPGVNADGKAEMRPLKIAGQIGQQVQIASGVKP